MDYTALRQSVLNYLQSDEPTFQQELDNLIRTAERRIYSIVRTVDSRFSVSGFLAAAVNEIDTPEDFQESLEFSVTKAGSTSVLLLKEPSFMTEAYSTGAMGLPRFYAILEAAPVSSIPDIMQTSVTLLLGPTPDTAYAYRLRYIRTPPSIVDVGNTWLGDHAHSALLYECLLEGARFLKMDPAEINEVFKAQADEDIGSLKRLAEGVQHMDTYRNPELRSPV